MSTEPKKQDVEEGTFALCLSGEKYRLYQFDTKSPLRSQPDWREVDLFDRQNAPPLTLESAEFDDEDGEVWAYADRLEPEYELEDSKDREEDKKSNQTVGKYAVQFDNGQTVSGNTQAEVMGNAVNVMVQAYDLLDKIEIPYMSGHKNALINNREKHPDNRKMNLSKRLTRGYYVSTEMAGEYKQNHIKNLAQECGAEIEFKGDWKEN